MKHFKILIYTCLLALTLSCTNNPYYEIPMDEDGNPILTEISTTTTSGVTTDDTDFTVTATLPNATAGDVMRVDLLKPQPHPNSESDQMLPLDGASQQVTVESDQTATVTITRAAAELENVGDEIRVIFNGPTDSAEITVTLEAP